jgi:hypothetical protein
MGEHSGKECPESLGQVTLVAEVEEEGMECCSFVLQGCGEMEDLACHSSKKSVKDFWCMCGMRRKNVQIAV